MASAQPVHRVDPLLEMGCAALTRAFKEGSLKPVEVVEALKSAVEAGDPVINAFCHFDWPHAVQAALAAQARYSAGAPLGPLDGVPVSVKDLIDVAGWPTRRGSRTMTDAAPASVDAPAVQLLRNAGAVLFGKTTTTEFGWTIRSDNPLTGLTRNPVNTSRSAGGSSSGAAAQVAAGWGPLALGSDAGGSVRVPASYCGLVGFKPSFGAIPMIPSSAFTEFAHLGVISRSVEDCSAAMIVLGKPDARDLASMFARTQSNESQPLRLGWSLYLGSDLRPDEHVVNAFQACLQKLRGAGYYLQEVQPGLHDCAEAMWMIWRSRMLESFYAWPAERRDQLGAGLQQLYREGQAMTMTELAQSRVRLRQMAADLGRVFSQVDLLLTPMMPGSAPVAQESVEAERAPAMNWFRQSGYAYPFNVTGQPAVSLPIGICPEGLPLGLQIVGRKYHDAQVLQTAAELERLMAQNAP